MQNQTRWLTANDNLILTPKETAIATEAMLARYQQRFGELPAEE